MRNTHTNERDTREVIEITRTGETESTLIFSYVYNRMELGVNRRESDVAKIETYSTRSRKLIDNKISEWVKG